MAVIFNVAGTLPKIRKKNTKKGIGSIYDKAPKTLINYAKSKGLGVRKLTFRFQGLNPKTGYALTKDVGLKDRLMEMVTIEPKNRRNEKWLVNVHDSYNLFYAKNMNEVVEKLKQLNINYNFNSYQYVDK